VAREAQRHSAGVNRGGLSLLAVAALLVAGAGYVQHRREVRPTVPKVVAAAQRGVADGPGIAAARRIDGLGFPAFPPWRITGGRADRVGDRRTATVVYARGHARISYTLVSGGAHVNYANGTSLEYHSVHGRVVELNWLGGITPALDVLPRPRGFVLTFKRNSRTTVLVGTPYRRSVGWAMRRLALDSL
jgi:hypothetical protein